MQSLRLISVWLHLLAAAVWIGGMIFLAVVLLPALRSPGLSDGATEVLHRVAIRFRSVGWVSLVLLLATGVFNLAMVGVGWSDVVGVEMWDSRFGRILAAKLTLVFLILWLSVAHDFFVGPRCVAGLRVNSASPRTQRLRRMASWLGRLNLLLALGVLALAVMLTRGAP